MAFEVGGFVHAIAVEGVLQCHRDVGSFRDLWNRIPFEKPILSRYWRIPPEEIPSDRDEMISWLFDWWSRIDAWISDKVTEPEEPIGGVVPESPAEVPADTEIA